MTWQCPRAPWLSFAAEGARDTAKCAQGQQGIIPSPGISSYQCTLGKDRIVTLCQEVWKRSKIRPFPLNGSRLNALKRRKEYVVGSNDVTVRSPRLRQTQDDAYAGLANPVPSEPFLVKNHLWSESGSCLIAIRRALQNWFFCFGPFNMTAEKVGVQRLPPWGYTCLQAALSA